MSLQKDKLYGLISGLVEAENENPSRKQVDERKRAIAESEFIKTGRTTMAKFETEQIIAAKDYDEKPLTRTGFAFVLITYGTVPVEFLHALVRLQTPVNCTSTILSYKGMEIGVARNRAIHDLLSLPLNYQPKYVLWLSDDELPPWDGLVRLWMEMENSWEPTPDNPNPHGWDVLSSLVYMKIDPPTPVLWRHPIEGPLVEGRDYKTGEVVPSDVADLGFGLMRMDIFTKLQAPWFVTGYEDIELKDGWNKIFVMRTEDCWFFRAAKLAGLRMGVHTGVRTGHLDVKSGRIY